VRSTTHAHSPAHIRWKFGTWTRYPITAGADLDELDAALGELRAAGWPAPEDPGGDDDAELDGRDLICDRLLDEVGWLRQCADWLTHLHTRSSTRRSTFAPKAITLTGRT
jgi:hypothetical protein